MHKSSTCAPHEEAILYRLPIKPLPGSSELATSQLSSHFALSSYAMYPQLPQPLLGNNMWLNMEFQNEHTAAYPNGTYPQCGPEATFENLPFDTNSISKDEKARTLSSLDYPVAPVDIGTAASPSFIPLAPEVGTQRVLDVPFNSSSVAPFRRDLAFQSWWPEQHPAHPLTPDVSQGYSEIPTQEPWEHDYPLAEAMEVMPHGHSAFHFGELEHRSILKKHRYEPSAYRIEGQGQDTRFMCTIENCGKNFSGEWEKTRHIKSMHCPPTIGCRKCNYKQSRKDLFSEHCKKRHPGESIEDLRVQLDVPDA